MIEDIKLAFQGIGSHKLRSLLTMLGIIIGIASIISIISTLKGTSEQIKENLIGSGNNTVTVTLWQGDSEYEMDYSDIPSGVPVITDAVRTQIQNLDTVEYASLYTERSYTQNVYYLNTAYNGATLGVDIHYLDVNGYEVTLGRGFSENDFNDYKKVALVDENAANGLFSGENPVGKVIEIDKEPFVVIGLISQSSDDEPVINSLSDYELYGSSSSGILLIPSVQWSVIYRYDEPQNVCIKATSTDDMTKAGQQAQKILNSRLTVSQDSDLTYKSNDLSDTAREQQELANSTNQQLIWIAGISLIVGGIGVMNIMLVSVTERTREIGLKKAIGAKERNILMQFLTEAAVLTSLGGIVGVVAGIIMAEIISRLTDTPVAISIGWSIMSVIFSMLIGIVAGLLPAVKAAKLNPIDALRRE